MHIMALISYLDNVKKTQMKGGEVILSKDRFEELETKEKQLEALERQLKSDKSLIVVKAYDYWEDSIHRLEIFPTKDVLISELLEINAKLEDVNKVQLENHKSSLSSLADMGYFKFKRWVKSQIKLYN